MSEVLRRVVTAEAREPIENPAGFATNAAQYAAADLLRGELRRPAPMLPTHGRSDVDEAEQTEAGVVIDDDVLARLALRDLRSALFDAVVSSPSRVATVLAYLASLSTDRLPGRRARNRPAAPVRRRRPSGLACGTADGTIASRATRRSTAPLCASGVVAPSCSCTRR